MRFEDLDWIGGRERCGVVSKRGGKCLYLMTGRGLVRR